MQLGTQLGQNGTLIALTIITELVFGLFYAWFVDWLKTTNRERGYASFLVVGGTFFTVALVTPIIGLINGLAVLAAFVLTGLPMILATTYRHTEDRAQEEQRQRQLLAEFAAESHKFEEIMEKLRQLEQQLKEDENDDNA